MEKIKTFLKDLKSLRNGSKAGKAIYWIILILVAALVVCVVGLVVGICKYGF